MELKTLNDLFIHQLKDLYGAEKQLLQAMPQIEERITSGELKRAVARHRDETVQQINRLEKVFDLMNMKPSADKCKAMDGLLKETLDFLKEEADNPVRDAGIIACIQRVEHYEIAGYGTACTYAKYLGHQEALKLLKDTLSEEKHIDERLTVLAESTINVKAAHH